MCPRNPRDFLVFDDLYWSLRQPSAPVAQPSAQWQRTISGIIWNNSWGFFKCHETFGCHPQFHCLVPLDDAPGILPGPHNLTKTSLRCDKWLSLELSLQLLHILLFQLFGFHIQQVLLGHLFPKRGRTDCYRVGFVISKQPKNHKRDQAPPCQHHPLAILCVQ